MGVPSFAQDTLNLLLECLMFGEKVDLGILCPADPDSTAGL